MRRTKSTTEYVTGIKADYLPELFPVIGRLEQGYGYKRTLSYIQYLLSRCEDS